MLQEWLPRISIVGVPQRVSVTNQLMWCSIHGAIRDETDRTGCVRSRIESGAIQRGWNMRHRIGGILLAVIAACSIAGCGGSDDTPSAFADTNIVGSFIGGGSGAGIGGGSRKGETTWTWGTQRGLYGYAEVSFNEDGGRDRVVMYYDNGKVYRQLEYTYGDLVQYGNADAVENQPEVPDVYPTTVTTMDAAGNQLYVERYDWAACEGAISVWGAGSASDITPIMEVGDLLNAGEQVDSAAYEPRFYSRQELTLEDGHLVSSRNYQEMSHLSLTGDYKSITNGHGGTYWLTQRVGGDPVRTWFYTEDGMLHEDWTITWNYRKGQPVSLRLGQYDTYTAEVSDDGLTTTYTLNESHEGETKYLTQIYQISVSYREDGKPTELRYYESKDYENTDEPEIKEYRTNYEYDGDVLSGGTYYVKNTGEETFHLTCNSDGMLETMD